MSRDTLCPSKAAGAPAANPTRSSSCRVSRWAQARTRRLGCVAGVLVLAVSLSGCLFTAEQSVVPDRGVGYQQVDIQVLSMGDPPENLTRVDFLLGDIAFFEEQSRQWVQVSLSKNASLVFEEDEAAYVATVTLPAGSYSKMWGSLGSVEVWEGGSVHPAVPVAARCHVPVSMDLDAGEVRPVLRLYVFLEDAFVKKGDTWFVQPAFSGSFSESPDDGEGRTEGSPRFTRPRCDTTD